MSAMCLEGLTRSDASDDDPDGCATGCCNAPFLIEFNEGIRVVSPVSLLQRRAMFLQKEPIRRDIIAVLLHIDASLVVFIICILLVI